VAGLPIGTGLAVITRIVPVDPHGLAAVRATSFPDPCGPPGQRYDHIQTRQRAHAAIPTAYAHVLWRPGRWVTPGTIHNVGRTTGRS